MLRQVETLGLNCIVLLANDNSRMWIPVWKLAEANLVNLSRSEKHIDFVKVCACGRVQDSLPGPSGSAPRCICLVARVQLTVVHSIFKDAEPHHANVC